MGRRVTCALLVLFVLVIAGTRLPLAPRQLFSFDDVNFAWATGKFDVRQSQPQPPGYPLFVVEMRLLRMLRVVNAQSNLLALALLGSFTAVWLLWRVGNSFFGRDSGLYGAILLLLHPAFWYAGLTSAVRVHLAVVSLAVAWACHRAWHGENRWVFLSALALGIGAGIRQELGVLLLPLWIASSLRAPASWRQRLGALALLSVTVLAWLAPTAALSGGPKTYLQVCWKYLRDQAALTSPLFGASERLWQVTVCRLIAWTFIGVLAWPMPLALAWRRQQGKIVTRELWAFLALWFLPSFAFALLVHVADAGQTLAMVPVVCMVGGRLVSCALDEIERQPSRWHALIWMLAATTTGLAVYFVSAGWLLLVIGLISGVAGWLMRYAPLPAGFGPPRAHAGVFLVAPAILLHAVVFLHRPWYYPVRSSDGTIKSLQQLTQDLHTGLAFMSLEQVSTTASLDHRALRAIRHLTEGHPRLAVILWERGLLSWRKAAYYYHWLPVVVLDRKTLAGPAPPVVTVWRGPRLEKRIEGSPPLRIELPRGARLIWLLNPRTDFPELLRRHFYLAEMESVYFCDLPENSDSRLVGPFVLAW